MRKFICISPVAYGANNCGFRIKIRKGDSISVVYTERDIVHCTTDSGHSFCIQKKDLDKFFEREFDYEEKKYYQQLRDKAAVAAMQGLIANGDLFNRIEEATNHEGVFEAIAHEAVKISAALVEELKATV